MPTVSIILPVYNVEQYLETCLESILCQSYRDMEIICINDGSTDGSAEILERYRLQDSRVKVITTVNQGVSLARNTGLKVAAGKYIYCVDSDDYLVPGSIEQMIKTAETRDLDVLVVGIDSFTEENKYADWVISEKQQLQLKGNYPDVYTGITLLSEFMDNGDIQEAAYSFMARRSLLEKHQISFVPHVIYEDVLYTTKLLVYAKRIAVLNQTVYRRRIRPSSIMTSDWGFESFRSMLISFMGIKQLITETAAYADDLRVHKRIINAMKMVIYYYSQLDEQQQTRIDQLPLDMQFAFYTDIYPHLDADHKIKDILAAFDQRTTDIATLEAALNQRATDVATLEAALNQRAADVATLEAALNQRAVDVATLEAALNQRAADVAALESRLHAIESTWLYKAASKIAKS